MAAPLFAADSVFVDHAWDGTWGASFPPFITQVLGPITFHQIDAAGGPGLMDQLGGAGTAAAKCPSANEKREFYGGTYDYSDGGEFYACTNGSTLFGVYRDFDGSDFGTFFITETDLGPPPSWSGTYTNAQGETGNFDGVYQGGGIATPLAMIQPQEISLLSADPPAGTMLAADSRRTFSALVEYDINTSPDGSVRLVVLDGQQQVIAESARMAVRISDPKQQSQLTVSAAIPSGSGQVLLRAELLNPDGSVRLSTASLAYPYKSSPRMLTVAPTRLTFAAKSVNPGMFSQTLLVQKSGSGGAVAFSAAQSGNSSWVASVEPSAGEADTNTPAMVTVTVNTQGLGPGAYLDAIEVTSALGTIQIPVTLVVTAPGPVLSVNRSALRFEARQGQGSSARKIVSVRNTGDAFSAVSWTARVIRGEGLVNLAPASGTSTPANPSGLTVTLGSSATAALGGNFALIEIADRNAQNSPQYVIVVVAVTPAAAPAVPLPDPAGLFFVGAQGTPPDSQVLTVNVSQAAAATFTASTVTSSGGNWLSVDPASATASSTNPGTVQVGVSTAALAPGVYRGMVNVTIGAATRGARVTLVVRPAPAQAQAQAQPRAAAGCAPTQAVVVEGNLFGNFSIPAGYPAALVAQLYDDCGDARGDGSVVATFSNGDAPLSLKAEPQAADYTATWQPGAPASPTTVRLTGVLPGLTADKVTIQGGVNANATPPPLLAPGGFIHNLNPMVGAPLAPGTVTQVYGDNLAAAPQAAASVPLPEQLGGVEVIIGGLNAPIYYVSTSQLTIQVPSELEPNQSYSAIVTAGNAFTLPEPLNLVPVEPGTVAFGDGNIVAQHADFSLVTADSPAKPGEVLTVYLVGMGATDPAVASGEASPASPLAAAVEQPRVTIDGQTAEILFAGLTPGGVGLYQINLRVPENARAGTLDVTITQAGVSANATTLIVSP